MKKQPLNSERGFTLIEILIYSAILAIFLAGTLAFINGILGSSDMMLQRNEVLMSQEFIERKIEWVIGNASQIQLPPIGTTSSQFQILSNDSSITLFSVTSGTMYLTINSGAAIPLHSTRVKVNNFSVTNMTSSSVGQVRILISMQSIARPSVVASSTFFYVLSK